MTIRKAMALSLALLIVGLTGSLLLYLGTAVVYWFGHYDRIGLYLMSTVNYGLGYGAIGLIPGLIAMTTTGCWYIFSNAKRV